MVKEFVIGVVLVGFALTSQADAQLFRRWGAPAGAQTQQQGYYSQQYQSQCQQQQELQRQQMLRMQQQEPRVAANSKSAAEQPQQVQRARQELLRQRQLLAQLQAALTRQQQQAKSGILRPRADYRLAIQRQLERQQQVVENAEKATKLASKEPVAPGVREPVPKTNSQQRDIAQQQNVKMPTLNGPSGTVPQTASVPQVVVQQPKPVELIEPAVTAPVGTLKKDSLVVPASAIEPENPSKTISILQAPSGKSVLEPTKNPGTAGKLELDGPASDK